MGVAVGDVEFDTDFLIKIFVKVDSYFGPGFVDVVAAAGAVSAPTGWEIGGAIGSLNDVIKAVVDGCCFPTVGVSHIVEGGFTNADDEFGVTGRAMGGGFHDAGVVDEYECVFGGAP